MQTVRRIRSLLAAGMATGTIASVLPCLRDDSERLIPTCPEMVAGLRHERERITRAIQDLQASRAMLDGVITAAPPEIRQYRTKIVIFTGRGRLAVAAFPGAVLVAAPDGPAHVVPGIFGHAGNECGEEAGDLVAGERHPRSLTGIMSSSVFGVRLRRVSGRQTP